MLSSMQLELRAELLLISFYNPHYGLCPDCGNFSNSLHYGDLGSDLNRKGHDEENLSVATFSI